MKLWPLWDFRSLESPLKRFLFPWWCFSLFFLCLLYLNNRGVHTNGSLSAVPRFSQIHSTAAIPCLWYSISRRSFLAYCAFTSWAGRWTWLYDSCPLFVKRKQSIWRVVANVLVYLIGVRFRQPYYNGNVTELYMTRSEGVLGVEKSEYDDREWWDRSNITSFVGDICGLLETSKISFSKTAKVGW